MLSERQKARRFDAYFLVLILFCRPTRSWTRCRKSLKLIFSKVFYNWKPSKCTGFSQASLQDCTYPRWFQRNVWKILLLFRPVAGPLNDRYFHFYGERLGFSSFPACFRLSEDNLRFSKFSKFAFWCRFFGFEVAYWIAAIVAFLRSSSSAFLRFSIASRFSLSRASCASLAFNFSFRAVICWSRRIFLFAILPFKFSRSSSSFFRCSKCWS